jgi:hypothetical protein
MNLPVVTLLVRENRKHGLLLCGVNTVEARKTKETSATENRDQTPISPFFSDEAVNDYNFRNRIVKWFGLWGYELNKSANSSPCCAYTHCCP